VVALYQMENMTCSQPERRCSHPKYPCKKHRQLHNLVAGMMKAQLAVSEEQYQQWIELV
jgi:hypothetical protein